MTKFNITSRAGVDFGIWDGETKAEALAALHREAGYECRVEGDDVAFDDEDTERLCGHVADWHIGEVAETSYNDNGVLEHHKPFAPTPAGGWTYARQYAARSLYRYRGEDRDTETVVTVPDQVADDQATYDGLAFPTAEGTHVWLDGDAYDLHGPGTGDMVVRDAAEPA